MNRKAGEQGERGFGVAGGLDLGIIEVLAREAEALGYRTFWVNDTPAGDGLAALAEVASVTKTMRLGVGVVPLDRQPAEQIATRVQALGLPLERLTLGVGSGGSPGGPERVRAGVVTLRRLLGDELALTVGALGPRMCKVAGEVADGVLLNWLTAEAAQVSAAVVMAAASVSGRRRPRVDGYVRSSIGDEGRERLRGEGERYASIPAYGAHFARMGVDPLGTAVAVDQAIEIAAGLTSFGKVLDETVVRAVTGRETLADYQELLTAAAPERDGEVALSSAGDA